MLVNKLWILAYVMFYNITFDLYAQVSGVNQAKDQINSGDLEAAEQTLLSIDYSAISTEYEFAMCFYYLAWVQDEQDKYVSAYDNYTQALSRMPDNEAILRSNLFKNRGVILHKFTLFDRAIEDYQSALKLTEDQDSQASLYYNLGITYYEKGDLDQAAEYFQISMDLRDSPKSYLKAHNYLALCAMYSNQSVQAIALLKEQINYSKATTDGSIFWQKKLGQSYHNLAECFRRGGDLDAAVINYQHALKYRQDSASLLLTYTDLGRTYYEAGDLNESMETLVKGLDYYDGALDTDAIRPFNYLAETLFDLGYLERSKEFRELYDQKVLQIIKDREVMHESVLRNELLTHLRLEQKQIELQQQREYWHKIYFLLAALLLMVVLFVGWRRYRYLRRKSEAEQAINEINGF